MNFKQYLTELYNIEVGQAIEAHEPSPAQSSSIYNPRVMASINVQLNTELNEKTLSAYAGIQKVRKVLHSYGLDLPALYDVNPEGDEIVFDVHQFGKAFGPTPTSTEMEQDNPDVVYLYLLYYLTDTGYYDFYAEISEDVDYIKELTEEGLDED